MILRTSYLNKLDAYRFCGLIKVIVGIRKCGKSTLMRQYIKKLQDENNDYNTIFINLNDFNTREKINNKKELNKYIEEKLLKDKKNFVFIDEVQEIPEFEIVLNSLSDHENVDIYVTGSNSKLLSSEISTLLTGKNIVINVYPLVFSELCNKTDNNIKEKFDDFFKYGGMPGRLKFTQEENIHEYLNMIYSDILRKDILARNKVFEISELTNIYYFIFDNLGKELSYKNIYEINKRNGCSLSQMSIIKYVELLLDCFLIQKVNKYDLSGLKLMENLYKYYPQDFGMRNAIFKNLWNNRGKILENIVLNELKYRGYQVFIGTSRIINEIDFVAKKGNEILYIQVTENLSSENLEREISPFSKIKDGNKRLLLSMEELENIDENGIHYKNIVNWLLGK